MYRTNIKLEVLPAQSDDLYCKTLGSGSDDGAKRPRATWKSSFSGNLTPQRRRTLLWDTAFVIVMLCLVLYGRWMFQLSAEDAEDIYSNTPDQRLYGGDMPLQELFIQMEDFFPAADFPAMKQRLAFGPLSTAPNSLDGANFGERNHVLCEGPESVPLTLFLGSADAAWPHQQATHQESSSSSTQKARPSCVQTQRYGTSSRSWIVSECLGPMHLLSTSCALRASQQACNSRLQQGSTGMVRTDCELSSETSEPSICPCIRSASTDCIQPESRAPSSRQGKLCFLASLA